MPPPSPPPGERRRDTALRALYLRVDTLEQLSADQATLIAVLEEKAVTKNWLMGGLLMVAFTVFGSAWVFKGGIEDGTAKAIEKLGTKVDALALAQTDMKIKVEAQYLLNVERRPREEVRQTVHRQTTQGD